MNKRIVAVFVACLGAQGVSNPATNAGPLETAGKKLIGLEAEVANLGAGLKRPENVGAVETADLVNRRLIDARVNFGVGNYDDAAVMLYDFVEKHPAHRSWDEALFFLAESLFQKGDYVASRSYFTRLVDERAGRSTYFQQGLERLIELTLKLDDSEGVEKWLFALDQIPRAQLRDSVPYVRGKYEYFLDKYDDALKHFSLVPQNSEYFPQAQYFVGVCQIAKGELNAAAKTYQTLIQHIDSLGVVAAPVENAAAFGNLGGEEENSHARISELSHMALGRLYYEGDQPSKAVDQYLKVDRRSDLFDDALFEVTWVYVKNKEFDKALRALELLALADPKSQRMPEVSILEGNLRIRKAQFIAEDGQGNSKEQYDRAVEVFAMTRGNFTDSHTQLQGILDAKEDPRIFMAQITGRTSTTFDVAKPVDTTVPPTACGAEHCLPEVATAWLQKRPEVARIVQVEVDLKQIEEEMASTKHTIDRLESAMNTASKINIFPSLAKKRIRSTEILEEILAVQKKLAAQEKDLALRYADDTSKAQLSGLQRRRELISGRLAALPGGDVLASERVGLARVAYTELEGQAAEIATVVQVTSAQMVALDKYVIGEGDAISKVEQGKIDVEMKAMQKDIDELRAELVDVRRAIQLAKDSAGTGDEVTAKRADLRRALGATLAEEHALIMAMPLPADAKTKLQQMLVLTTQSRRIVAGLESLNGTIDAIVEEALGEIRLAIAEEKANLIVYKREFGNYETESRGLGGNVLASSFEQVTGMFYDILVRSDVGLVDVAWSLKESAETTLKRLNLDNARESRTLDSNFADVLQEIRDAKTQELFDRAAGK